MLWKFGGRSACGACPLCGSDGSRVLFMGAPMWLCSNENCNCVYGFWSWVAELFPVVTDTEDGPMFKFMSYEPPYLLALLRWLIGKE